MYVRQSTTGKWLRLSTALPSWITAGDLNDDGLNDVIGTWKTAGDMTGDSLSDIVASYSTGTWYRNSATGAWKMITTPAEQLAAGDIDGGGRDDLIGIWSDGVWLCDGATGGWQRITSSRPRWITTGRLTDAAQTAASWADPMESAEEVIDLSHESPGAMQTR